MRNIKSLGITALICLMTTITHSQTKYDLSMPNASVVEIIDTLSQMMDCKFSFPTSLLKNDTRKNITISEQDLNSLLDEIFNDFDIEYSIANSQNILLREENLSLTKPIKSETKTELLSAIVLNDNTNLPVEFAAVAIPKHNLIEFTDASGKVTLNVKNIPQDAQVKIHMLGYEINELSLRKFKQNSTIELQEKPNEIEEITILGRVPKIQINSDKIALRNNSLQNLGLGLAGNDALRSIQMLAGIDASDDSSTDIKIRGSNADETLIILDGIPLYNTSHYYGIFSSLNSDYIQDVNVYKNAQPIQYGNKTAGVVEFKSNQNFTADTKGKINLNLLESSVSLSSKITDNSYLNISGRKTLRDISNTTFNSIGMQRGRNNREDENVQNYIDRGDVISSEPEFNFWDLQAKYFIKPNKTDEIQFSLFMSQDNFTNQIEIQSAVGNNRNSFLVSEKRDETEIWKTTGIGFNWKKQLNKDLSLDINSYYSNYNSNNETEFSTNFVDRDNDNDNNSEGNVKDQVQFNTIKDIGLNAKLSKTSEYTDLNAGLNIVNHNTEFEIEFGDEDDISQNLNSTEITSYGEVIHRLNPQTTISAGIRTHFYTGTNEFYFSPQLSITHLIHPDISLKSSISQTNQFLRELTIESVFGNAFDRWVLADGDKIPVSNSTNSMVGLTVKKYHFTFDAEWYYKKMSNVTELSLTSSRQFDSPVDMPTRIFIGEGRSYGMDLLLSTNYKRFVNQFAYTLSKVEHSFAGINRGRYFNAANDRRHQLKLINEYSFDQFTVGINYIFSSGRIFTDLSKLINIPIMDRGRINPRDFQSRLPNYHRFDLSFNYKLNKYKYPITLGMGVFNILDRQNVKYQQQIVGTNNLPGSPSPNIVLGTNSDLLGRTLNLKFGVEF